MRSMMYSKCRVRLVRESGLDHEMDIQEYATRSSWHFSIFVCYKFIVGPDSTPRTLIAPYVYLF